VHELSQGTILLPLVLSNYAVFCSEPLGSRGPNDEEQRQLKIAVTVGAFFAASAIAAEPVPPLEVHGVLLGATVQQHQQAIPQFKCYGATCTFDPIDAAIVQCGEASTDQPVLECYGRIGSEYAFGPVHGAKYSAFLKDGRVGEIRVTFPVARADEVVVDMTEKFGKPASDRQIESQSRLGEKFSNRTVTWSRSDGTISVERRAVDIDTGSATFVAPWYAQATANGREIAAESGAKGL
jgi:hypothetical protein